MGQIYLLDDEHRAAPLKRVYCKDEDSELQQLLASNPNLLPGDQINPGDPCRWLLISREVPVPDPVTGSDHWSIDVLLADQNAIPTFVECKRFLNTQARREVVGQMLEYAANGHYYWTAESLRDLAEGSAPVDDPLDKRLAALMRNGTEPSDFFQRIEANLREGQVRLVFFLDEAPGQLKSIVDLLNRQMERAEVLIVEAFQFETGGIRFVAPSLFGYTEQARMVKRTVTVTQSGTQTWNEGTFFTDLREKVSPQAQEATADLLQFLKARDCTIRWGRGQVNGSFSAYPSWLKHKSLLTMYSNGTLDFNQANLVGTADLEDRCTQLLTGLRHLGIDPSTNPHGYTRIDIEKLAPKLDELKNLLSIALR